MQVATILLEFGATQIFNSDLKMTNKKLLI